VLLAALLCLMALVPATAGARAPRTFFGMQTWGFNPTATAFDAMGAARIGNYRLNLLWGGVEPTPGKRIWVEYDQIVTKAARNGITLLPTLFGSPSFAAKLPTYPPKSKRARNAFLAFVHDAVARYGHDGTFWHAHPGLRYTPITAWQVWNEPNFPAYWFKRPNPRSYVRFLARAAKVIRRTDPRGRVVLAGIPDTHNKHGMRLLRYIKALYRAPGFKRAFDVMAVHTYARNAAGVARILGRVRRVMRAAGDGRTPLWVTEFGWSTRSPKRTAFATTARGQARRLTSTLRMFIRRRARYHLGKVFWFSLVDRSLAPGERDWWAPYTGLFKVSGAPKRAWFAFVKVTGGKPAPPLSALPPASGDGTVGTGPAAGAQPGGGTGTGPAPGVAPGATAPAPGSTGQSGGGGGTGGGGGGSGGGGGGGGCLIGPSPVPICL
jgi:hypothetical protein